MQSSEKGSYAKKSDVIIVHSNNWGKIHEFTCKLKKKHESLHKLEVTHTNTMIIISEYGKTIFLKRKKKITVTFLPLLFIISSTELLVNSDLLIYRPNAITNKMVIMICIQVEIYDKQTNPFFMKDLIINIAVMMKNTTVNNSTHSENNPTAPIQ